MTIVLNTCLGKLTLEVMETLGILAPRETELHFDCVVDVHGTVPGSLLACSVKWEVAGRNVLCCYSWIKCGGASDLNETQYLNFGRNFSP